MTATVPDPHQLDALKTYPPIDDPANGAAVQAEVRATATASNR